MTTMTVNGAAWDSGDYKVGERVRLTKAAHALRHIGAEGDIIRVDADEIYPIIVWLDVFGPPTSPEALGMLGLPLSAVEIERVEA